MNYALHRLILCSIALSLSMNTAECKDMNKKEFITLNDKRFAPYIAKEKISQRIEELGKQIRKDYAGKKPIFIGILNGAVIFMSDLMRSFNSDCEIDFIKVSSYENKMESSGTVTLTKELSYPIEGRDIIIVEDIIDSGRSIQFTVDYLKEQNPCSIRIATLLHKNLAKLPFTIDYIGFNIPPNFVVGCGLDYAKIGRNLRSIYILADE